MTTEFYIGGIGLPSGDVPASPIVDGQVSIDKGRHDELSGHVDALLAYLARRTYALPVAAFLRLREHVRLVEAGLLSSPAAGWGMTESGYEIAVRLVDWLLTTGLFLDHSRYELTKRAELTPAHLIEFDEARRHEHKHHFGYRLMYDLRNYSAHCGLPPLRASVVHHVGRAPTFALTLDPALLLDTWDGWNAATRQTLLAMRRPFELMHRAEEYMECINRLELLVRDFIAPGIGSSCEAILEAGSQVTDGLAPALLSLQIESGDAKALTPIPLPTGLAATVLAEIKDSAQREVQ